MHGVDLQPASARSIQLKLDMISLLASVSDTLVLLSEIFKTVEIEIRVSPACSLACLDLEPHCNQQVVAVDGTDSKVHLIQAIQEMSIRLLRVQNVV